MIQKPSAFLHIGCEETNSHAMIVIHYGIAAVLAGYPYWVLLIAFYDIIIIQL